MSYEVAAAKHAGLDPDLRLDTQCAEFYVLESLQSQLFGEHWDPALQRPSMTIPNAHDRDDKEARLALAVKGELTKLEDKLTTEFVRYISLAGGGELRHMIHKARLRQYVSLTKKGNRRKKTLREDLSPIIERYFKLARESREYPDMGVEGYEAVARDERGLAWYLWDEITDEFGLAESLDACADAFYHWSWQVAAVDSFANSKPSLYRVVYSEDMSTIVAIDRHRDNQWHEVYAPGHEYLTRINERSVGMGYGGQNWGAGVRLAADYANGRVTARTFIDRCWAIQHNGGSFFNKLYGRINELTQVLVAQKANDYPYLATLVSDYTRDLWVQQMFDPCLPYPVKTRSKHPGGNRRIPPGCQDPAFCVWCFIHFEQTGKVYPCYNLANSGQDNGCSFSPAAKKPEYGEYVTPSIAECFQIMQNYKGEWVKKPKIIIAHTTTNSWPDPETGEIYEEENAYCPWCFLEYENGNDDPCGGYVEACSYVPASWPKCEHCTWAESHIGTKTLGCLIDGIPEDECKWKEHHEKWVAEAQQENQALFQKMMDTGCPHCAWKYQTEGTFYSCSGNEYNVDKYDPKVKQQCGYMKSHMASIHDSVVAGKLDPDKDLPPYLSEKYKVYIKKNYGPKTKAAPSNPGSSYNTKDATLTTYINDKIDKYLQEEWETDTAKLLEDFGATTPNPEPTTNKALVDAIAALEATTEDIKPKKKGGEKHDRVA